MYRTCPFSSIALRTEGRALRTMGTVIIVAPSGFSVLATSLMARSGLKICSNTSCVITKSKARLERFVISEILHFDTLCKAFARLNLVPGLTERVQATCRVPDTLRR